MGCLVAGLNGVRDAKMKGGRGRERPQERKTIADRLVSLAGHHDRDVHADTWAPMPENAQVMSRVRGQICDSMAI